jgi:AraC-like DNA-binding protein
VNDPLAAAIRQLCDLAERDHDPVERETLLARMLTELIAHYSDYATDRPCPAVPDSAIQPARDYIQACYAQKLSLDALAQTCHLSPYHFQRVFVEHMGLSPHDYLMHTRIRHSKSLLRQGMPLADVAQDVGFVDQSHFTHSFKRIVGLTPGYFARQQQ